MLPSFGPLANVVKIQFLNRNGLQHRSFPFGERRRAQLHPLVEPQFRHL